MSVVSQPWYLAAAVEVVVVEKRYIDRCWWSRELVQCSFEPRLPHLLSTSNDLCLGPKHI